MRFDQGWETEQFEVGVGKPNREGFAPCDVPGATAASGRIEQFPRDSQCDQGCTTATWCFPLTPQSGPQSQSDPTSESDQHLGRFAKAEIAAPTPHIRDQFFHCRLDADALGPSRDLPDSPLEPLQRVRRDRALDVWTSRETEPEELPFLRSCHRTLGLVYLELELLCDEARNALHHPLTRAFAANVDVTVVRITNKAVSAALQLAVEFIEHEVTQQWRKRSSLRSSFHAGADQSVLHHPGIEECPDELQQPLVLDALGDLAHQFVVIDSIKELFQIEIDHPSVALRDVLLRLSHSVMRRSTRSKPVAVLGKRRVPSPLQNLHHRLLDEAIQHGWDAKLSHPSIRLRDFHPPHRSRFVSPVQQLLPNSRPVLLQIVAELVDRHPVDARATFVAPHLPQCFLQVCSFTCVLHDTTRVGWAFGLTHHRERFDVFPSRLPGFTRRRRREVQSQLDIQPLVALEIHVLFASPLVRAFNHRFRFGLSVDSTFRRRSASLALPTTWPTMPSADFCPAVRPPYGALSRRSDTAQISWGKFSRFPCTVAGSTLRVLDGYGLRGKWPARPTLAPCTRFLSIDSHVCSTLPSDLASRRQPLRCR